VQIETILILLVVGGVGGAVRSVLGYKTQADEGEQFDWLKFAKSVVRAAIAGSALVYYTIGLENIESKTYVTAFFLSVGGDVLVKEIYGTLVGG
jgi:hypothetical protein